MKFPRIKYPKLMLFFFMIIVSIIFFEYAQNHGLVYDSIMSLGYIGTFFAGFFYTSGFTSVPATTILLLLLAEQGLFVTWIIASIGAILGDIILVLLVSYSFEDEIQQISEESIILHTISLFAQKIAGKFYKNLLPMIAAILISTPLPTEVGITLMTLLKTLKFRYFIATVGILHMIGIFVMLFFAQ